MCRQGVGCAGRAPSCELHPGICPTAEEKSRKDLSLGWTVSAPIPLSEVENVGVFIRENVWLENSLNQSEGK
jgi:hypothetical protein